MVYASATVSLAILEVLIHLDTDALLAAYSLCRVEFDESFMTRIDPGVLPENWREYPAPRDLQMMGDRWIEAQSSVVLEVPSVISPNESNFLLNADHPHFVKIVIGAPQPFSFDRRIRR
jgi:RES domain-containing protein